MTAKGFGVSIDMASDDAYEEIKVSSEKASRRARRLDNFDFEELTQPDPKPLPIAPAAE